MNITNESYLSLLNEYEGTLSEYSAYQNTLSTLTNKMFNAGSGMASGFFFGILFAIFLLGSGTGEQHADYVLWGLTACMFGIAVFATSSFQSNRAKKRTVTNEFVRKYGEHAELHLVRLYHHLDEHYLGQKKIFEAIVEIAELSDQERAAVGFMQQASQRGGGAVSFPDDLDLLELLKQYSEMLTEKTNTASGWYPGFFVDIFCLVVIFGKNKDYAYQRKNRKLSKRSCSMP